MGGNVIERAIAKRCCDSKAALKEQAQIAKLRRQLKVIMVDESQDTDQLQIELIASLIFERNFVLAANGNRISKNG